MQQEAHATMPQGAASAHSRTQGTASAHSHAHARRYSTVSLLGASVLARLAIVSAIVAVLWIAIAWALA
jgi:hypothetical protein